VDELWLRIGVKALVEDKNALPVVFGPLHLAASEERLPRDLWRSIDRVAPPGSDPAQRFRLLLLQRIREEQWSSSRVGVALKGAGPHAREVLRDLEKDDPLTKVFKAVLKRLSLR
jgi:hypothetical protein